MHRPRLHVLEPATLIVATLLILLAAACSSSTTGATRSQKPTGTAAPPPTSGPSSPSSSAPASAGTTSPVATALSGAPGPTCIDGWHSVVSGTADYAGAALLLPQIAGAKVVRVFSGPLPGTGTGLHVYARTDSGRLLAVQTGDGPAVVMAAAANTADWKAADWHRTGAAPAPSASAAALLPPSQAGCLDGS